MKTIFLIIMTCGLALGGCVIQRTEVKSPAFDQQMVRPQPDYSKGSIWQSTSGSLTENFKARRKGDIVTIVVSEVASASKKAATGTDRSSSFTAGIPNFLGLESGPGMLKGNNLDLSKMISASTDTSYAGSGSTSRQETLNATISAKVVEVMPNGNLLIEGRRNVQVNNEDQIIVISGTVRPADIDAANNVNSIYLADARISYTGKGVISDRQSPGWIMNILDKIWPF